MASTAQITEDLLIEIGRRGTAVTREVESAVRDTVVDLLEQAEGRFRGLEKTQTISIVSGTKEYKLNADFGTTKDSFAEYNSDGDFAGKVYIFTKSEVQNRLSESAPTSRRMGYIQFYESHASGRGSYLILSVEPTESVTFEFDYYRNPTPDDTDIIRNTSILKHGARGRLSKYFDDAEYNMGIFLRMRSGFRETPERVVTDMIITPSARTGTHNKLLHKAGAGG